MVFLEELLKNKVESSRNPFHLLGLDFGSSSLGGTFGSHRSFPALSWLKFQNSTLNLVLFFFYFKKKKKKLKYF